MNRVLTMMLAGMLVVGSTFAFAEDVYVTKNGKKYHKADCLLIKNKGAKAIPIEEALKRGLKPCHKCLPQGVDSSKQEQVPVAKTDAPANSTTPSNKT